MFLFCFCVAISRSTSFFDFPNRLVFCCWLCRVGCCGVGCTTKPPSPLIDSLPDGVGVSTTSFTTSSSRSYVALQRERKAGGMALWRTEGGRAYGYTQMGNNTSPSLVPSHSRFLLLSFYSTSAFLMKSLMNANTVYRHDCDPDWGQIKEGALWWVGGRKRKAFAISLLHGRTAVMFPVFLPSLSCPVYRLLIKACRLVHLIRIHQRELGDKKVVDEEKGITPLVVDIAQALLLTIKLPMALFGFLLRTPPPSPSSSEKKID